MEMIDWFADTCICLSVYFLAMLPSAPDCNLGTMGSVLIAYKKIVAYKMVKS